MDLSNENIVHIKNGDVEYLQFKELLKYSDRLVHCYSLKPLVFSDQNPEAPSNYKKICNALGIDSTKIIKSAQKHTDIIEDIKEYTDKKFDYVDGFITKKNNIPLVTKYADCTPIILYDKSQNIIANVHSGWRGTLQRISQKAVKLMEKNYNSNPTDIIVCIGPCIKQCHFQVEGDFIEKFRKEFGNIEKYYKIGEVVEEAVSDGTNENAKKIVKKQKYYFDTTSLIIDYLTEIGIKKENIFDSKLCSVCHSDMVHSYRVERQKADRNICLCQLNEF